MISPSLSPLLQLQPASIREQFRVTPSLRRLANRIDRWAIYITIFTNIAFVLRAKPQQHADCFSAPVHKWYYGLAALAFGQWLWLSRAPSAYLRWRDAVLICNRLVRVVLLSFYIYCFRNHVATGCHLDCLAATSHPALPSATPPLHLPTLRNLSFASMAVIPFFHGICLPLAFPLQVALQLLQFLVLVRFQLAPAVHLFNNPRCTLPLSELCESVNSLMHRVQALTLVMPSHRPHVVNPCSSDVIQVMMVYLLLYFGVAVPCYVAYRVDRRMKEDFLMALQSTHAHQVDLSQLTVIPIPHVLDVIMLTALALLSWVLVINAHGAIAALALQV